MLNEDEDISIGITYSFTTFPQANPLLEEPTDYVTEIVMDIRELDAQGNPGHQIGQGQLSLLHFSLAMEKGYSFFGVIDASASILEMAEQLFNITEGFDCWEKIEACYDYEPLLQYDICFLERMEILPAYRKKGIGKLVISNLVERFYGCCGLVVVKASPLQHETENFLRNPEWQQSMEYSLMETDYEKARYQLFNYYQKLGFINPLAEEYFMIRPHDFIKVHFDTGAEEEGLWE